MKTRSAKIAIMAASALLILVACQREKGRDAESGGGASSPKSASISASNYKLTARDKSDLLRIARSTVDTWVTKHNAPQFKVDSAVLLADGAAFVTLNKNGKLRGCIGHTVAREPLWMCVRDVAVSACSQDPRFKPVKPEELDDIVIEVSVLTPLERVPDPAQLVMGRDGVVLKHGGRIGVFLPQVATETGWSKDIFLGQLCRQKAGLPWNCWKNKNTELYRFEAIVFDEENGKKEKQPL